MTALAYAIFVALALVAAGFAAGPVLWRMAGGGRYVLGAAAVLLVLGIGGGLYLELGEPALAVRSLKGADDTSPNALIARLAAAMRDNPGDARGWALLGEAYDKAQDAANAAGAFSRAIDATRAQGQRFSFLYSAYGRALVRGAAGAVTPEAQGAFEQAVALDPTDVPARYFLGLAAAARGDGPGALQYWNRLLAEVAPQSALHADLVDRVAALTARLGGTPDVNAMVAQLAARLRTDPGDTEGWRRLIRAYAVMGDKDKARATLSDARRASAGHGDELAALDSEAKALGL